MFIVLDLQSADVRRGYDHCGIATEPLKFSMRVSNGPWYWKSPRVNSDGTHVLLMRHHVSQWNSILVKLTPIGCDPFALRLLSRLVIFCELATFIPIIHRYDGSWIPYISHVDLVAYEKNKAGARPWSILDDHLIFTHEFLLSHSKSRSESVFWFCFKILLLSYKVWHALS